MCDGVTDLHIGQPISIIQITIWSTPYIACVIIRNPHMVHEASGLLLSDFDMVPAHSASPIQSSLQVKGS